MHGGGDILSSGAEDLDVQYEGNMRSVFFALRALLPPLVEQKSGQVVINTSAGALRPQPFVALYCATHAGANALIRAAGLQVAPYGVTVNGTGTYAFNYPDFLHDLGADINSKMKQAVLSEIPTHRLVQPEEAAHFVATLIDGKSNSQTAQYFAIDGGWSFV